MTAVCTFGATGLFGCCSPGPFLLVEMPGGKSPAPEQPGTVDVGPTAHPHAVGARGVHRGRAAPSPQVRLLTKSAAVELWSARASAPPAPMGRAASPSCAVGDETGAVILNTRSDPECYHGWPASRYPARPHHVPSRPLRRWARARTHTCCVLVSSTAAPQNSALGANPLQNAACFSPLLDPGDAF